MESDRPTANKKAIASFILVLAVVLIAVAASVYAKKNDTSATMSNNTASGASQADTGAATSPAASPASHTNGTYKDGTYTASGSYATPESQETINVTLTVQDGAVTDSSVQQTPQDRESRQYQRSFADNYKPLVIGKKLSDINLSHVSGSSLTSEGFNRAVQAIAGQAKQS